MPTMRLDEFKKSDAETLRAKNRAFRLGDVVSAQTHPVGDTEFDVSSALNVTPGQRIDWQRKGKIGYLEQLQRQDKTEMIPFFGAAESMTKNAKLLSAVNRLKSDQFGGDAYAEKPNQKIQDVLLLQNYLFRVAEEQVRGYSIGGNIARGQANVPGYMLEFLATGGALTVMGAAGRASSVAGIQAVTAAATRNVATKMVAGSVVRTALVPQRFLGGAAERQVAANLEFTPEGLKIASRATESPFKSVMIAMGDQVIENFSETTGPALTGGIRAVMRTSQGLVPKQMANALTKLFIKMKPNQSVSALLTRAGYNGFIEELGEERVGDLLRAITGVNDFGAGEGANVFDRIIASIPNGEELLVEAGVLAPIGAGQVAVSRVIDGMQSRREQLGEPQPLTPATAEEADVPDEVIDRIIEGPQQAEAEPTDSDIESETIAGLERAVVEAQEVIDRTRAAGEDPVEAEEQKRLAEDLLAAAREEATRRAEARKPVGNFQDFFDKPLRAEIDAQSTKADKLEIAQLGLDQLNEVAGFFKRRLDKKRNPDIAEELKDVPAEFVSKEGMSADELMDEANNAGIGVRFETVSDMVQFLKDMVASRARLKAEIAANKPKTVRLRDSTVFNEKIRNIKRGFKTGKRIAFKEVKAVQDEIIKQINASALEKEQKAQFLSFIKNTQSVEKFVKKSTELQLRIDRMDEANRKRDLIQRFKENTSERDIKRLRPEFQSQARSIRDQLDPSKLSEKKMKDLDSLARFLKAEPDNSVPQKRIDELNRLSQVSLRDMNSDEIDTIVSSLGHLFKINALKNKIIVVGKVRDAQEIEDQAVAKLQLEDPGTFDESVADFDALMKDREKPIYKNVYTTMSYNTEIKAEIIDQEDNGVWKKVLYTGIDKGVDKQLAHQHQSQDYFARTVGHINTKGWSTAFETKKENIKIVEIEITPAAPTVKAEPGKPTPSRPLRKRKLKITPAQRVSIWLHSLNKDNRRHLIEGGIINPFRRGKVIKISEEDLDIILDSMTEDEIAVGKAINTYLNTIQKDAINQVSLELDGYEIANVDNYFPIRTIQIEQKIKDLLGSQNANKFREVLIEGQGIFKERTGARGPLILEDAMVATYRNMLQASSYIGLAAPLRSAKQLINSRRVQQALIEAGRKDYIESFKEYLIVVEGENLRMDNVDRLVQELINKLDVAILGLNPWVMAKQPVSYLLAATEMDLSILASNFKFRPKASEVAEIKRWSPQLRDRFDGNVTREAGEVAQVGRVKRFWTGEEVMSNNFMAGIRFFDSSAVTSIWRAVKAEQAKKNPNLDQSSAEFMEKVAERAWEVIRKTQPTFHKKDRSTIGAKDEVFIRLLTKYSSQRNKNWMILRRSIERYNRSHKTPADKAKVFSDMALLTFAAPAMIILINSARNVLFDRKDEVSLFESMVLQWIEVNFGSIYFVGTLTNAYSGKIRSGNTFGFQFNDPVTDTANDVVSGMVELTLGIKNAITQERYKTSRRAGELKWKTNVSRAALKALDTAGRIRGIPIETVRKLLGASTKRTLQLFGFDTEKKSGGRRRSSLRR